MTHRRDCTVWWPIPSADEALANWHQATTAMDAQCSTTELGAGTDLRLCGGAADADTRWPRLTSSRRRPGSNLHTAHWAPAYAGATTVVSRSYASLDGQQSSRGVTALQRRLAATSGSKHGSELFAVSDKTAPKIDAVRHPLQRRCP